MEITFNSKSMGLLIIKEIPREVAKQMIIEKHYSHKWNTGFGRINIGIFKYGNEECLGVASFGNPMNPNSYNKISDDIGRDNLIELNRMWIDDVLGRNAESILISNSFKIIKSSMPNIKIVQTFADGRLGCGTIYKATNFKYYGYTKAIFLEDVETGEIHLRVNIGNTRRYKRMIQLCDRFCEGKLDIFEVKTHKYLYVLDKKLRKKIKLKEEHYPEYEKSKIPSNFKPSLNSLCRSKTISDFLEIDCSNIDNYLNKNYSKEEISESMNFVRNNEFIVEIIDNNRRSI